MTFRTWRWWHWVGVSLGLLVLTLAASLMAVRSWGLRRLATAEAALQAAGRPLRYHEVMTRIPPENQQRQEAWVRLMARAGKVADPPVALAVWVDAGAPRPAPAEVTGWLDAQRGLVADLSREIRAGGFVIGHVLDAKLFSGPQPASLADIYRSPLSGADLLGLRSGGQLLKAKALVDDDPEALKDLDRLCANLQPGTLVDGMIHVIVLSMRDQTRLVALYRDGVDPGSQHWMHTPPVSWELSKRALCGERLLGSGTLADHAIRGGFSHELGLWGWVTGPAEAALMVECMSGMESQLDGVPWSMPPMPRWSIIAAISLPNVRESTQALMEFHAQERAVRIAAQVIVACRQGGEPPADASGLTAEQQAGLAGSPRVPALRYQRTAEGFRIGVDPTAPLPAAMLRQPRFDALAPTENVKLRAGVQVRLPAP